MRLHAALLLPTVLVCCTTPDPRPSLSELAQRLRDLPDRSIEAERASRIERDAILAQLDTDQFDLGVAWSPTLIGTVVETFGDRVAVCIDDQPTAPSLPLVGTLLIAYDNAGVKAEVFVVQESGGLLLGQVWHPRRPVVVGDRATAPGP